MLKLKERKKQIVSANKERSKEASRERSNANLQMWKPGQSGNPNGRPKMITDALNKRLREKVKVTITGEDGKEHEVEVPRVELIANAQIDIASTLMPHSVSAFRTIREIVEPTDAEQSGSNDKEFIRAIAGMLLERKVKAIEI